MPILIPLFVVIVLLFIGAFGGKPGKVIAIAGIIMLFLWYVGLEWLGIPLPPLRHFAGQAILAMPLMVKQVRRVREDSRLARYRDAGWILMAAALVVFALLLSLKVV